MHCSICAGPPAVQGYSCAGPRLCVSLQQVSHLCPQPWTAQLCSAQQCALHCAVAWGLGRWSCAAVQAAVCGQDRAVQLCRQLSMGRIELCNCAGNCVQAGGAGQLCRQLCVGRWSWAAVRVAVCGQDWFNSCAGSCAGRMQLCSYVGSFVQAGWSWAAVQAYADNCVDSLPCAS